MDFVETETARRAKNLMDSLLRPESRQRERPDAHLGLSESEIQKYSLAAAIRATLPGASKDDTAIAFARECSQELAKKFDVHPSGIAIPQDVLGSRGAPLNYLVGASAPDGLSFMDMLRQRSVVFRLGAQHLPGLKDDVSLPRQLTDVTLQWLGLNASATASDSTFGQLSAVPKRAVAISEVSEQLLKQSSADRVLMAGLASALATGIDLAAINGAGGVEPLGILNTTGIGTLSGTSLAYVGLVGVQKTVANANAVLNPRTMGYVFTPTVAELLKNRQRFTGTDTPLWTGALHEGEIEGVVAASTKQMLTATGLYGDWSTVNVCEWGPLMLSADRGGTRFNLGQVGIRAQWFVDAIVTSPLSWVKITSIT